MDAGKAAAVTSASMAPPSAPVRRTAPSEAVKGYQGSMTPVRESGAEDTVELSTQGRMMAQKLSQPQASPQQAAQAGSKGSQAPVEGGSAATTEALTSQTKEKVRVASEQQKVLDELRKKEEAALEGRTNLTDYEKARMARLDQIQLMIDQGKYQVDNFIVDRVAVDLAKLMV